MLRLTYLLTKFVTQAIVWGSLQRHVYVWCVEKTEWKLRKWWPPDLKGLLCGIKLSSAWDKWMKTSFYILLPSRKTTLRYLNTELRLLSRKLNYSNSQWRSIKLGINLEIFPRRAHMNADSFHYLAERS